jgi:hypothetical protein
MDAADERHRDRIREERERRLRVLEHRLTEKEPLRLDHSGSMIDRTNAITTLVPLVETRSSSR